MEICIVGAGPGGAATALKLSYLGIPSVLIDKQVFPRDKVCGDALSGKVITLLNRLDPDIMQRFAQIPQQPIWGIRFIAPNRKVIDLPFKVNYDPAAEPAPGFVARRMDFDNFLISEVRRRDNIRLMEGVEVGEMQRIEEGYRVKDKHGATLAETPLLIVANGAHSQFARKQAGMKKELKHYAAAVRAYYENVSDFHPDGFIELHFLEDIIPGYFWVFPLPEGGANVGLGMRADFVKKKGLSLRKKMDEIIREHPAMKERFARAKRCGEIEGYGLPLGSSHQRISGERYMLVGDAGHLIDPLSGEGIGNAMYSGFIAADQAADCLAANDFSAETMLAYDKRVDRVLGSEFRISYRLQKMLSHKRLAIWMANLIHKNRPLIEFMTEMYNDLSARKKLLNPLFWIKLLGGGKR